MIRLYLAHHLEQVGHLLSSPLIAAMGLVSLLAAETLPGENALLRAGFAAAAITALAVLTKRVLRFIRGVDKKIDDWQDTTQTVREIPAMRGQIRSIKERQDAIVDQQATTSQRLDALDRGQAEIVRQLKRLTGDDS